MTILAIMHIIGGYHHSIIGIPINYYFALGYGGQHIIIVPEFDLVVVFTSRIYNNSLRPMYYFKEFILKAIEV